MGVKLSKFNYSVEFEGKYLVYNSLQDVCYILSVPLSQMNEKVLLRHHLAVDENVDEDSMAYEKMVNML